MKHQQWLILFVALVLLAGTAGVLAWLKTNQKLGQPGIKATPIPGSVMMQIDLPERVLDFTSTNMPESEVELGYFPKDTSYVRRHYQAPDGFDAGTVIIADVYPAGEAPIPGIDRDALVEGIRKNHSEGEIEPLKARIEAFKATMLALKTAGKGAVIEIDWLPESGTRVTDLPVSMSMLVA